MQEQTRQSPSDYYDTPAAARYLNMAEKTLQKLRWAGGGPPYYKLDRIRYRRADLDAWRESRRRISTSDPGPVAV
jgi:hypothetical protein